MSELMLSMSNGHERVKSYFEHFVGMINCRPTLEKPSLLVLDGHSSHTTSMHVLDYASANGVIMLSLRPRTTHYLQPLDEVFFKLLQN